MNSFSTLVVRFKYAMKISIVRLISQLIKQDNGSSAVLIKRVPQFIEALKGRVAVEFGIMYELHLFEL
jgi:hypothetical protein